MDFKNQIMKLMRQKLQNYCEHSSLHGFCYFTKHLKESIYFVWTVIILSCFGLCIFLWHMIWHKFTTDPTFTVVESIHYLTSEVPFPAVTICDSELVYGPNTRNITEILKSRNYDDQQVAAFYRSFTAMRQRNYVPEPYLRKMYSIFEEQSLTVADVFELIKKPCDLLIVECIWRLKRQPCKNLFREVATVVGHCCLFDMKYFRTHAENETNFIVGIETIEALQIVINSETILFDNTVKNSNAMLYIFDSIDSLGVHDAGETLIPSSYIEINLDVWVIDSSENVKSLTLDERRCTTDKDKQVGSNCINGLLMKKIIDYCQCVPFSYHAKEMKSSEQSPCGWDRLLCSYQALEREMTAIRETISMNKCYEKCDYVQYDNKVEYLRNCNNDRKSSNMTLVVKYADSTCLKYRREVLYTWDQMLANLGGVFGLCLGGSIISIIELLWYIIDVLWSMLFVRKSRVDRDKRYINETVFTVTQNQMMRKINKKHGKPYNKRDRIEFLQ